MSDKAADEILAETGQSPGTGDNNEVADAAENAAQDTGSSIASLLLKSTELTLNFKMKSMDILIESNTGEEVLAGRRVKGCFAYDRYEIGEGDQKLTFKEKGEDKKNFYWIDNYHNRMHVIEHPPGTIVAYTVNRVGFKYAASRTGEDSTWFDAHLKEPDRKKPPKPYLQIQQGFCSSKYTAVNAQGTTVGSVEKKRFSTKTFVNFEDSATLTERLIVLDFAIYCANCGIRVQNIVPTVIGCIIIAGLIAFFLYKNVKSSQ